MVENAPKFTINSYFSSFQLRAVDSLASSQHGQDMGGSLLLLFYQQKTLKCSSSELSGYSSLQYYSYLQL